jgi:hypothetical protein
MKIFLFITDDANEQTAFESKFISAKKDYIRERVMDLYNDIYSC